MEFSGLIKRIMKQETRKKILSGLINKRITCTIRKEILVSKKFDEYDESV